MKMNKIIIPAAMLAVGVALVGSVSSTLAWYQYSTKAQAAFIGTSIGKAENLEIKNSQAKWVSRLEAADVNALASATGQFPSLLPVTPGKSVAKTGNDEASAIPAKTAFKNGIETGVAGYRGEAESANIIQFDLKIRYKQVDSQTPVYLDKYLKLVDLTIMDNDGNSGSIKDLYKTIRVHFAVEGGNNYLFANDNDSNEAELTTQTYGNLDTDNDGKYDKVLAYEWESSSYVTYGIENTSEVAYNAHALNLANNPINLGQLAADEEGTTIKVTIWLEGWQKLSGVPSGNLDNAGEGNHTSSMWDPAVYKNKKFNVGMRFQAFDEA